MNTSVFFSNIATESIVEELSATSLENPFITLNYLHFLRQRERLGWVLGVKRDDGKIETGCIAYMKKGRINKELVIPSLPAVSIDSVFWDGLRAFCKENNVTYVELCSFASNPCVEIPLFGNYFVSRRRCEFVLNLQCDFYSKFSANHKRNIKKAEKHGVVVTHTRSMDAVSKHIILQNKSMDRRRARGEDVFFCDTGLDTSAYLTSNAGEIFQASYQGDVVSSILILYGNNGAYYQSAGTSLEGMKIGASQFLIYNIACYLSLLNIKCLNFGGAEEGTGLFRFKSEFGATKVLLSAANCHVGSVFYRRLATFVNIIRSDKKKLFNIFKINTTIFFVYCVDTKVSRSPQFTGDFEFKALCSEQIIHLNTTNREFYDRQINRLERFGESYAYGVFVNGEIAHISWLLPHVAMDRDSPRVIASREHEAEITGAETLSAFQRRGLYYYAICKLLEVSRDHGIERVYMKTSAENNISQSVICRAGFKFLGRAFLFRFPLIMKTLTIRNYKIR